jgi:hypothetical protein
LTKLSKCDIIISIKGEKLMKEKVRYKQGGYLSMSSLFNKQSLLVLVIAIPLALSSCGLLDEQQEESFEIPSFNHTDSFIRLEKQEEIVESTPVVDPSTIEVAEEYKDLDESDYRDAERLKSESYLYKDTYESNIAIDYSALDDTDIYVDWFNIPDDLGYSDNVYQWVAYAIKTYYNGNVTETFTFDLDQDIVHQDTNMIFDVAVHGETTQLIITLDMFNDKIVVNEQ